MRKLTAAVATAVVAWAALIVPLPLLQLAPAPAQPVPSVIDVASTSEQINGQLLYTVVSVAPVTTVGGVQAWVDPYTDVELQRQVVPSDVDPQRFFQMQRRVFHESLSVAAAVGERLAGRDVSVSGDGARVVSIVPGAPAEEELQPGDVIVAAEGQPIELASQLVTLMGKHEAGDEISLTVRRGEERIEVTVTLDLLSATDRPGLGVLVQTVNQQIDLPVPVQVEPEVTVGGPSAGLMMALTVYDLLDPVDLTAGRAIAGTGTVDLAGNVGPIGGISEKVRGADLAGASLFLAPASQAQQARSAAPEGITVIGVKTVQEAIDALKDRQG